MVTPIKSEGNLVEFENADMLYETPFLDIKHYIPEFNICQVLNTGGMNDHKEKLERGFSDERFINK